MGIGNPLLLRGLGQLINPRDAGVGVGFNDINLPLRRHADIETDITVHIEGAVSALADIRDPFGDPVGQFARGDTFNAPMVAVFIVHFAL